MAGARVAAGSDGSDRGSLRRSMLLAGQDAVHAARTGVSSALEEREQRQQLAKSGHGESRTTGSLLGSDETLNDEGIGFGTEEHDPLLTAGTRGAEDGDEDEAVTLPRRCARASIFPLLQQVRDDIRATIDTHLEWSELTSLDINYAVVRPLSVKYSAIGKDEKEDTTGQGVEGYAADSLSVLFVFLVNRLQFQRDADRDLALQGINTTRAALCELLAMKLLRTYARNPIELITALTFPFSPFQGASEDILAREGLLDGKRRVEREESPDASMAHFACPTAPPGSADMARQDSDDSGDSRGTARQALGSAANPIFGPGQCSSALELAILTKARKFIKTPLCQRCINGIYEGRVVLSYQSAHAIVDDSYKKRPLGIYDPATAPFLDHHRLRVPLIRGRIEFCNFIVLLVLYVACLSSKRSSEWTVAETVYSIWLASFALDELAQLQEHGMILYVVDIWNCIDFLFIIISVVWFALRVSALRDHDVARSDLSFDTLSLGAILLCPRVASALVQDNVILLALKAMFTEFAFFMVLAVVCFSGFAYSFWQLSSDEWSIGRITWLMTKVWLGNSYILFDTATEFSVIYGPTLMVLFSVLCNTLLLTILISLLSNTFSMVAQNAVEEAMYQFACKTVSGISSEALLSYQMMPLNLIALVILGPASLVLSPRYLHKLNVYLLRATSWPILLLIRFGTFYGPSALKRRRRGTIGTGTPEAADVSLANKSASMTLFGASHTEQAAQYFGWLSLPRSRGSHDRDIFEAAFARAKAESRLQKAHISSGQKDEETKAGDDAHEADNLAESSRHLERVPPREFHATPNGSRHLPHDEEDEALERFWARRERSSESPLARIFGRAWGRNTGRGVPPQTPQVQDSQNAQRSAKSTRGGRFSKSFRSRKEDPIMIDDTIRAGQSAFDNDDDDSKTPPRKSGETSPQSNKQRRSLNLEGDTDDADYKDNDARGEQGSTHALLRNISARLGAYEQRQQRIEDLLGKLVDDRSTNSEPLSRVDSIDS